MATFNATTPRTRTHTHTRTRISCGQKSRLPRIAHEQLSRFLYVPHSSANEIDIVSWNSTMFNVHSWALWLWLMAHGYVNGSRSRQTMEYDIVSFNFAPQYVHRFMFIWIYRVPQALVRTQMASFYICILRAGARLRGRAGPIRMWAQRISQIWFTIRSTANAVPTWINSIPFASFFFFFLTNIIIYYFGFACFMRCSASAIFDGNGLGVYWTAIGIGLFD